MTRPQQQLTLCNFLMSPCCLFLYLETSAVLAAAHKNNPPPLLLLRGPQGKQLKLISEMQVGDLPSHTRARCRAITEIFDQKSSAFTSCLAVNYTSPSRLIHCGWAA